MTPIRVRMMAAYGGWMNGRMLDLRGTLPDAERKRDLGAFFKSIHGTVDHLIYGDVVTHMFNHATHHRRQLTTLMKQLGVQPRCHRFALVAGAL